MVLPSVFISANCSSESICSDQTESGKRGISLQSYPQAGQLIQINAKAASPLFYVSRNDFSSFRTRMTKRG